MSVSKVLTCVVISSLVVLGSSCRSATYCKEVVVKELNYFKHRSAWVTTEGGNFIEVNQPQVELRVGTVLRVCNIEN